MIHPLTEETAAATRARLLSEHRYHRAEARRSLRELERLEETCRRHGIRLVREALRPAEGESHAANPHHR